MTVRDERNSMYAALAFGGFVDAAETERVTEWAAEYIDTLEHALKDIASADPVDLMLDPTWSQRIARAALDENRAGTEGR